MFFYDFFLLRLVPSIEPEILLWCFNMYRGNNFEQLGATLVISSIFIGYLRYYSPLIG